MKRFLLLFLLLPAFPAPAAEEKSAEMNEEQIQDKFSAAEERFKDNPDMLRVIHQLKEGYQAKNQKEETPAAPPQPDFDASKSVADSAYNNGDYETAFKHYKALAEKGDAEAGMMLGVMYQGGLGTDKNRAAAHAWYKKSSEEGMSGSGALLEQIEETDISSEELQEAEKYYADINKQADTDTQPAADKTGSTSPVPAGNPALRQALPAVVKPGMDGQYPQERMQIRQVRYIPEKINPMPHPAPTTVHGDHIQPERYYRKQPSS